MVYNYSENLLNKRIKILIECFNLQNYQINLDCFFGDAMCVELLGNNELFNNVIDGLQKFTITLYSQIDTLFEKYDNTINIIDTFTQVILEIKNLIIIIPKKYYTMAELFADICNDNLSIVDLKKNKTFATLKYHNNISNIKYISNIKQKYSIEEIKHNNIINIHKIFLTKYKMSMQSDNSYSYLKKTKACYVCKKVYPIKIWIDRYKSMCLQCGIFNFNKKNYVANMKNTCSFVTGIRAKIGLGISLKLLRCGSRVIGTTRYPNMALVNFQKEKDYSLWKDDLVIIKCDFLKLNEVQNMLKIIEQYSINILINNAAQTFRHTENYLKTINNLESKLESEFMLLSNSAENINSGICDMIEGKNCIIVHSHSDISMHIDQFGDIKDYPQDISWNKTLDKINPGEIIEANLINQLVPTLIVNHLLPHMSIPKFIINVTAIEGQFDHHIKTDKHAHVNMCKAGMNMMIRTLSESNDPNLHVYCVDPGYVSGIDINNTNYPLDIFDGASRVLDPIMCFYNGEPLEKKHIKLRNYKPYKW